MKKEQPNANQRSEITIGFHADTKEPVMLTYAERSMTTAIVGSVGTGMTARIALPMLNQDIAQLASSINGYSVSSSLDGQLGTLSGISVIEPYNDLCKKTLELAKAQGIPNEAITYINPLDPHTPGINPMYGPVEQVAETVAEVLIELNSKQEHLSKTRQLARRNHVMQYVHLLKMHEPTKNISLDDLLDMYKNPFVIEDMLIQLMKRVPENTKTNKVPAEKAYWTKAHVVIQWMAVILYKYRSGSETDLDDLRGIRNTLESLAEHPSIYRVLFSDSTFDYVEHVNRGGLLLVNTAKAELGDYSSVIGKFALMNLQRALLQRSNGSKELQSYHHIMIDKLPDYLHYGFLELTASSRVCKVIVTAFQQTFEQIEKDQGKWYMTTLLMTLNQLIFYGDIPTYDTQFVNGQLLPSSQPIFQEAGLSTVKYLHSTQPSALHQMEHKLLPPEAFRQSDEAGEEVAGAILF